MASTLCHMPHPHLIAQLPPDNVHSKRLLRWSIPLKICHAHHDIQQKIVDVILHLFLYDLSSRLILISRQNFRSSKTKNVINSPAVTSKQHPFVQHHDVMIL